VAEEELDPFEMRWPGDGWHAWKFASLTFKFQGTSQTASMAPDQSADGALRRGEPNGKNIAARGRHAQLQLFKDLGHQTDTPKSLAPSLGPLSRAAYA
jgi:hypothetical protein